MGIETGRRSVSLAILFVALSVCPAAADVPLSAIFGLDSFFVTPGSGVATESDLLTVDMSGVAGSALVPEDASATMTGPFEITIDLSTPYDFGAAIPTPWIQQTMIGPLAPGAYDFLVTATTGSRFKITTGPALAFEGFVVVPESTAVLGDYNNNALVDAADYSVWRDHLGQNYQLNNENPSDANPGVVDHDDYVFWKSQYGNTSVIDPSGIVATSAPEPATASLVILVLIAAATRRPSR